MARRCLSAGLMLPVVLLLLLLNDLPQPGHIRRHDSQRDRPTDIGAAFAFELSVGRRICCSDEEPALDRKATSL